MTNPTVQPGDRPRGEIQGAIRCPHCVEMVRAGATFCPSCTRRVLGFAHCTECHEPISADARYCPYCAQRVRRFRSGTDAEAPSLDIAVRASGIGGLVTTISLSGLFRPSVIQLREDAIFIRRAGGLLASGLTMELPLAMIEDVHSRRGLVWGAIEIVPRAEAAFDVIIVRGIARNDAVRFANQIGTILFRSRTM